MHGHGPQAYGSLECLVNWNGKSLLFSQSITMALSFRLICLRNGSWQGSNVIVFLFGSEILFHFSVEQNFISILKSEVMCQSRSVLYPMKSLVCDCLSTTSGINNLSFHFGLNNINHFFSS